MGVTENSQAKHIIGQLKLINNTGLLKYKSPKAGYSRDWQCTVTHSRWNGKILSKKHRHNDKVKI